MSSDRLPSSYWAPAVALIPCGNNFFALSLDSGELTTLDAETAGVLRLCCGYKTLEDHAEALVSGNHMSRGASRETLHTLVATGLLRPIAFNSHLSAGAAPRPMPLVTTVGIPTRDRPRMLERCLSSSIAHCNQFGHNVHFVVVDGSQVEENRRLNQAVVYSSLRQCGHRIDYVGYAEAERLRCALAAEGFGYHVLEYSLTPGALGANRNLLLLLTAGRPFLMLDDDILLDTWNLPGCDTQMMFAGHEDPRETRFFASRIKALEAVQKTPIDVLRIHSELLGRSASELYKRESAPHILAQACVHLITLLANSSAAGMIRVTCCGIAGDCGADSPHVLLLSTLPCRSEILRDRGTFELAMSSREALRLAPRYLVTHNSGCMGYCMGVSSSGVLPPFLPIGRNSDGVFGRILSTIDTSALFGHVPCGVIHDSQRPSRFGTVNLLASHTRLFEVVFAILFRCGPAIIAKSVAARRRMLSAVFRELAELELDEFAAFVAGAVLEWKCRQLDHADAISRNGQRPAYWRDALERCRTELYAHAVCPDYFVPVEFHHKPRREALSSVQLCLRQYGEVLDMWPALMAAAQRLDREALFSTYSR